MVTRVMHANGVDFIELADTLDELTWFVAVQEEAREQLLAMPDESLPSWAKQWKAQQQ